MSLAADIRDPSHIDLLNKALVSVRQMCVDYAAAQTVSLRAERDSLRTEADMLRQLLDTANAFLAEGERRLAAACSERDALRALLADARPLVKGRLLDSDGPHGDASILARIDEALVATAVRTGAVPSVAAAPNIAHLNARSNALTIATQALERIANGYNDAGHIARAALAQLGAASAPSTDAH